MARLWIPAGLLIWVFGSGSAGSAGSARPVASTPTGDAAVPASACRTGCADLPLPAALAARLEGHVEGWLSLPAAEPGLDLETLLFHRREVGAWLDSPAAADLPPARRSFLERELARDRARIELRVVDADGRERLRLDPTDVRLGKKAHLHPEHTLDLQPPEVAGTVERVGLTHLWTRL